MREVLFESFSSSTRYDFPVCVEALEPPIQDHRCHNVYRNWFTPHKSVSQTNVGDEG